MVVPAVRATAADAVALAVTTRTIGVTVPIRSQAIWLWTVAVTVRLEVPGSISMSYSWWAGSNTSSLLPKVCRSTPDVG